MPLAGEKGILEGIRAQIAEAQNLLLHGRTSEAAMLDREILRQIVRLRVDRACIVSQSLDQDIEQLYTEREIDPAARDDYHRLRELGDAAEAGYAIQADEANEAQALAKAIFAEYMSSVLPQEAADPYAAPDERRGQGRAQGAARQGRSAQAPGGEGRQSMAKGGRYEDASVQRGSGGNSREPQTVLKTGAGYGAGGMRGGAEEDLDLSAGLGARRSRTLLPEEQYPTLRVEGQGTSTARQAGTGGTRQEQRPRRQSQGSKSSSSVRRKRKKRPEQPLEVDIVTILKIVGPVLCLVLMVILVRVLFFGGKKSEKQATTAAVTETETEESQEGMEDGGIGQPPADEGQGAEESQEVAETPAETEAPVIETWVTTAGVRVRTGPSTSDEVLDVLDEGTEVTYKGESGDFIIIDYNGQDAYVSKQYVRAKS